MNWANSILWRSNGAASCPQKRRGVPRLFHLVGVSYVCSICAMSLLRGDDTKPPLSIPASVPNRDAIQRVERGELQAADAAWWGYDPEDATAAIQGAINSGATTVLIPYVGSDWKVRPIRLRSHQNIVLDPGVVIAAKEGEFRDLHDCLLSGTGVNDITIRGYGATLRMRQQDYVNPPYERSEFRHALSFRGSERITVLGLTLQKSGGDGIYVGPTDDLGHVPCRDVVIRDCTSVENYRQGMSVVSAERLRIENCVFRRTKGTAPQAGLALEPAQARGLLSDIEVINTRAENNEGSGFVVNISRLNEHSAPVGVRFWNCISSGSWQPGYRIMVNPSGSPKGLVEFVRCTGERIEYAGLYCAWSAASSVNVRFKDCKWRLVARKRTEVPFHFNVFGRQRGDDAGRIEFNNCYLYDDRNRAVFRLDEQTSRSGARSISGDIHVFGPMAENNIDSAA